MPYAVTRDDSVPTFQQGFSLDNVRRVVAVCPTRAEAEAKRDALGHGSHRIEEVDGDGVCRTCGGIGSENYNYYDYEPNWGTCRGCGGSGVG